MSKERTVRMQVCIPVDLKITAFLDEDGDVQLTGVSEDPVASISLTNLRESMTDDDWAYLEQKLKALEGEGGKS